MQAAIGGGCEPVTMPDTAERQDALAVWTEIRRWLTEDAYPVWADTGVDPRTGGFQEAVRLDGAVVDAPRRARVQPRQIYSYALAERLGWRGPWRAIVERAADFYLRAYRRPDGLFRTLVSGDGAPLDDSVSNYDQAFALFALAQLHALGDARAEPMAEALLNELRARRGRPQGGFEESEPPSPPLQSNPHMHLFEAALAWAEAGGDGRWTDLAAEIATLARDRFIHPQSGALREFFDSDWSPAPGLQGRLVEPGHQFEWAWLMTRWGLRSGDAQALQAGRRLYEVGEGWGYDPVRGVAFSAVLDDGTSHDTTARLWPQTERAKAAAILAVQTGEARYWTALAGAGRALLRYFDVPVRGLWRDKLRPDGTWIEEPAPASSFYHIVCAIDVASDALGLAADA